MPEADDWLRQLPPLARFVLQGGRTAREAAGRAFGVALPEGACRAHSDREHAALWLGPDEQLLLAPAADGLRLQAKVAAALQGIAHSLVDVSQRQSALAVTGPRARDLLSSGCPLDLDPEAFPVHSCARTLFARAEVVLWRPDAEEYHLEIPRSFSRYVLEWLREVVRSDHP
ncbi:MAG TPA: sarcosine oxidase subunit gamma family protein [Steroidobacteraceae bacterium]|nr:sarcosine oxidase subunit gamma family protein [Steroidobacteraceae bacterium]